MNILTFDIEEWFHILDNDLTKSEKDWLNFESRIEFEMNTIFEIIDKFNVDATFFVVGWVAEKYPNLIRKLSDLGFEVASHTHLHQLAYTQSRKRFYNDVEKSIKTIEDCTGKKVTSFRAPGFSITENNLWAFQVLYELGIKIDCSVFPGKRFHGGLTKHNLSTPSIINYNGMKLKEFPINIHTILNKNFVFSGGGYFRIMPYRIIKNWTKKSNYVMSYFHPRDFDYLQPPIPGLSPLKNFKSTVGLKNCKSKLEMWLKDFDFIDLKTADRMVDWSKAREVHI